MLNAKEKFEEIINKILLLELDKIKDDVSRDDVEEWDSMTHLVLISDLEQVFDIIFSDDDISNIKTIGDIKKVLEKYGIHIN